MKKRERDSLSIGYCSRGMRPDGSKPKRSYATKSAAKRAMKAANAQKAHAPGSNTLKRVYECACGDWHTSSG
jgi:hypothetical protein